MTLIKNTHNTLLLFTLLLYYYNWWGYMSPPIYESICGGICVPLVLVVISNNNTSIEILLLARLTLCTLCTLKIPSRCAKPNLDHISPLIDRGRQFP